MAGRSHYVADFETTSPKSDLYETDEEQTPFEEASVWASAIMPVDADPKVSDITVHHNIDLFIHHLHTIPNNSVVWFHNLAFDVSFLLLALMVRGYEESESEDVWAKPARGQFKSLVADNGTWYSLRLTLKTGRHPITIEFRDSFKIVPFKLDAIAKSLKTKAKKLTGSIDYTKHRPEGYRPTDEEIDYINNDVLVMSEALDKLSKGDVNLLDFLTIGGACMDELKKTWGNGKKRMGEHVYRAAMPVVDLPDDRRLRESYKGGWCINNTDGNQVGTLDGEPRGHTLDVNSLYPSVMRGHRYPVGDPDHRPGSFFYSLENTDHEWIVRFQADFTVKENHVPFVQDKSSIFGDQTHITNSMGNMELTMTKPDYQLFTEQYDITRLVPLDVWVFDYADKLFDNFVDKWYQIKHTAKAAGDEVNTIIAKLMLNNAYGKLAQSPERASGIPYLNEQGHLKYSAEPSVNDGGYIPVGSYITSYARGVTIRAAQALIDSGRTFHYADTDSVHFSGSLENIEEHLSVGDGLGQWDHEGSWDTARFVRQKTYIENIVTDTPHLDIKAAGATPLVKERMTYHCTEIDAEGAPTFYELTEYTEPRTTQEIIDRYQPGLVEAGKLRKRSVRGGVVLEETTFRIHLPSSPKH